MQSSNRVILNTGFLYANMVVTMAVQLVSVRLLVNALGVADYAIYTIVAGIVALFAFINVAMSASTQRYISYAIGEGRAEGVREIFYQSVILHLVIGLIVTLLLEVGGQWYVHSLMQAPPERIGAASILLHCITASTFVNIITVPYEADINANEDMGAIAAINILDALMKLGVALVVVYCTGDKLILYGTLTMACLIVTLVIKRIYCLTKYAESHVRWHAIKDFTLMRGMASFAVWNLIGAGCGIARYQGAAIVLNQFFALAVNTAYGIAQQVNALLLFFANSIVRAVRPQVVKSEGAGDRARMLRLSQTTCRITSLMVALLAIPLGVSIEPILRLWLGHDAGAECVMFCRAFLAVVFLNQLTIGLQVAIESTGRIRLLQCVVGAMHIVPVLLGYACFKAGMPPSSIMLCVIAEEILAIIARAIIARHITGLRITPFLLHNVTPCLLWVLAVTALTQWVALMCSLPGLWQCLVTFPTAITLLCAIAYFLIIDANERKHINGFVLLAVRKLGVCK